MNKIESFKVDHRKIKEGVYISRIDGDRVTYDLRMRKPNTGDLISNSAMHSLEHLFATMVRNSHMADAIIYFGPMGCQTGFYLLVRNMNHQENLDLIKETLEKIIDYSGEMPGNSEIECGNFRNLDMDAAKNEASVYFEKIKNKTTDDMRYEQ